jgi:hypothetical protein
MKIEWMNKCLAMVLGSLLLFGLAGAAWAQKTPALDKVVVAGCRPQWFLKIDILCTEESFPEFSGK